MPNNRSLGNRKPSWATTKASVHHEQSANTECGIQESRAAGNQGNGCNWACQIPRDSDRVHGHLRKQTGIAGRGSKSGRPNCMDHQVRLPAGAEQEPGVSWFLGRLRRDRRDAFLGAQPVADSDERVRARDCWTAGHIHEPNKPQNAQRRIRRMAWVRVSGARHSEYPPPDRKLLLFIGKKVTADPACIGQRLSPLLLAS